jgi:multisubunit Na+/H+ antiporter MnhF subunit
MPQKRTVNIVTIEITSLALVLALLALVFWFAQPPVNINVRFVGVDNTTFIYVVYVSPLNTYYWTKHFLDTIYGITTYTGGITVNCTIKPHPPFTITVNSSTLYITLLCPTAITLARVNTTNGVVPITVPLPS